MNTKELLDNKAVKTSASQVEQVMLDRCIPVAKRIQSIIHDADLTIGLDLKSEKIKDEYDAVAKSVLEEMLKADLQIQEVEILLALVSESTMLVANKVKHAMGLNLENAVKKLFGHNQEEVTMSEIDKILKS